MNFKNLFFSALILLSVGSCQKSSTSPEEKKEPTPTGPSAYVYVGGTLNGKATHWKNDEIHQVNNADGTSVATAISVQGDVVYLAGYSINTSGEKVITSWKNGVPTYLKNLGNTTADGATGIAVRGNDVYVIGRTERYINGLQTYSPTLWKNGVASYVTDADDSFAYAITITSNGDVYIAGRSERRACYWKNGVVFFAGERDKDSWAYGMCVSGTDVYLAGSSNDAIVNGLSRQTTVYWKNGIKTALPINGNASALKASSIAVSGPDVYAVGSGLFDGSPSAFVKAIYWKNGTFIDISAANDAKFSYIANAVAVSGNDVYAAVSMNGKGYLLKNSIQITLPTNGATSFDYKAITIVPK